MAQVPAKIVLKSTTRMSLNDRFTNIQKSRPPASVQNIRAKMAAQQQASVRNRRLAQQMANRPSVIAALKIKRRNLKQRLGSRSNVKSRLSLSLAGRGRGGGRGRFRSAGRFRSRGFSRGMIGKGSITNLTRQQSFLSVGGAGDMKPNLNLSRGRGRGRGRFRGRGGFRGGRGSFRGMGIGGFGRLRGGRGSGRGRRGNRRFRGRGIPRGGTRGSRGAIMGSGFGAVKQSVTREELDNQLDEYMSKTKAHLDAELDAYMAQANE